MATAVYLGLTAIPLAAGELAGGRLLALIAHLGALALVVAAEQARRSPLVGRWARAVSDLHVLALIPALYAELPLLMDGMPGAVVYRDAAIQAVEGALFGFQPSWELAGRWPLQWLSETVHLAYLLYYPIIFAPPLLLYVARRPGDLESEYQFERAALALALSMFSCYLVFVAWPVQGPRYIAAPEGIPEGPFRALTLRILEGGSSRGAAFPSSHVAVAVTQSLVLLRFRPRLGAVVVAVTVLLALGAVYGGFHYAVDALAGALFGALAWRASGPLQRASRAAFRGFAHASDPI